MATETVAETGGLIDALARILRQLIRTPKFRDALTMMLNSIDPAGARELVRVLFWEDTGLFLAIVGAVPALVNAGCELVAEAAVQLNSMPKPLLQEFMGRVVDGIDGAAAGEAAGGLVSMVMSLGGGGSRFPESLASMGEEFGRSYRQATGAAPLRGGLSSLMDGAAARARDKDSTTYAFIQEASKALEENPAFVEHVLKPLLSPALRAAAEKPDEEGRG
jgi:hypothetical protein